MVVYGEHTIACDESLLGFQFWKIKLWHLFLDFGKEYASLSCWI